MVRCLLAAVLLLLPGAVSAQDGISPPVMTEQAPEFGSIDPEIEEAPLLPGVSAVPQRTDAAGPVIETDLISLVLKAHWVVQAVMATLTLAIAAVVTVGLFKSVEFLLAFRRLRHARAQIATAAGLVELPGNCPLARTAQAAQDEALHVPRLNSGLRAAANQRLEVRLERIEASAVAQLRSGTGILASIGSVGPFVGLFGTVFGIMNSFLAISAAKTTNLSVVAPGIAEALLATGIGLVAAIPAVLLYNAIMRRIAAFRHALADGRAEILVRFSRELDRRMGSEA